METLVKNKLGQWQILEKGDVIQFPKRPPSPPESATEKPTGEAAEVRHLTPPPITEEMKARTPFPPEPSKAPQIEHSLHYAGTARDHHVYEVRDRDGKLAGRILYAMHGPDALRPEEAVWENRPEHVAHEFQLMHYARDHAKKRFGYVPRQGQPGHPEYALHIGVPGDANLYPEGSGPRIALMNQAAKAEAQARAKRQADIASGKYQVRDFSNEQPEQVFPVK